MCFISVITPVYNNKEYISKAIENYLQQGSTQTELIIVDGGSTDGTVEIIKAYAEKNGSIRWLSEKDNGQSNAMNKGIRMAQGEFISFLNVDDYYSEEVFKSVISLLKNDTTIDFLVGDCQVWDADGGLIYVNRPSKIEKWHLLSGYHFPVNPTAYFYRKKIHFDVGLYNEANHLNMDLEFLLNARMHYKFHYVPELFGNFRLLPNTKTVSEMENNQLEIRKKELLDAYFAKTSLYIQFRVQFYRFYRGNYPKLRYQIRRIRDKIRFEIKKLTH